MENSTFLARIALDLKLVSSEHLGEALRIQEEAAQHGKDLLLGRILVDRGWLKQEDLDRLLQEQKKRLDAAPGLSRYELRQRVGRARPPPSITPGTANSSGPSRSSCCATKCPWIRSAATVSGLKSKPR
jgi:hypothetical protein